MLYYILWKCIKTFLPVSVIKWETETQNTHSVRHVLPAKRASANIHSRMKNGSRVRAKPIFKHKVFHGIFIVFLCILFINGSPTFGSAPVFSYILMSSPLKQRAIASHSWCLSHPPRSTSHLRPVFGWRCLHPSSNPWTWQGMFHDGTILLVMTYSYCVQKMSTSLWVLWFFLARSTSKTTLSGMHLQKHPSAHPSN